MTASFTFNHVAADERDNHIHGWCECNLDGQCGYAFDLELDNYHFSHFERTVSESADTWEYAAYAHEWTMPTVPKATVSGWHILDVGKTQWACDGCYCVKGLWFEDAGVWGGGLMATPVADIGGKYPVGVNETWCIHCFHWYATHALCCYYHCWSPRHSDGDYILPRFAEVWENCPARDGGHRCPNRNNCPDTKPLYECSGCEWCKEVLLGINETDEPPKHCICAAIQEASWYEDVPRECPKHGDPYIEIYDAQDDLNPCDECVGGEVEGSGMLACEVYAGGCVKS